VSRVVLVTGVSRHLGGRLARVLAADPAIDRVLGVDVVPPRQDIGAAEFVRADIRNPVIGKIIAGANVDTVVHMGVIATPLQAGGRVSMKEINVIGTMQLLAACQRSTSVAKLVVKSSSTVYGAGPRDPAFFTEDTAPKHPPRSGWGKDSVEVESYVRGFSRRRPDVEVTTLRFANVIGSSIETPMTSYFDLPTVPTVLGYDARLQFVHENDCIAIVKEAAIDSRPGVYNVAGEGVISLSQAVARAGRVPLPVPAPLVGPVGGFIRHTGLADFSREQVTFLSYGRALDTTRLREHFETSLQFSTMAAFDSFVEARLTPIRGALSVPAATLKWVDERYNGQAVS